MSEKEITQAGKIASQVKVFAKSIIKKDILLLEIAEKIENKIIELRGKPAFPVNLSINEIAAHYTPTYDDKTTAYGLLKIDLGVHVNGWVADTSFSIDLENSEKNKKLIEASKKALENAEKIINSEITLSEIGKEISKTINSYGFNPIVNLTGHSIEQYNLHSGLSISNIDNKSNIKLGEGLFAIEPFATDGKGKIYDGKTSGIYSLIHPKNTRSPLSREILDYIVNEFSNLPFCSRWIIKKFGTKSLIALKQLEQEGILHQYHQLIEVSKGIVSQAENTFLIKKDKVINTSK
jgi:methionyl aminopeptidase